MKLLKTLLIILFASLVIGFFYVLTLMSPGKTIEAPSSYIDPTLESSQLLKQSEMLESDFEKSASIGMLTNKEIEKLRKSIKLQEIYIEKSRASSSDRAPINRLSRLRTRLHNIEAEPLARLVADFEKNAQQAESSGDARSADKFYKQAYDIQDKINRTYYLSKFKNVTKVVELDKQIKNLQVRPMYEMSLAAEKKSKEAVAKADWKTAVAELENAIDISRNISLKFPTSGYNDYIRIQRLRRELDSLKSSDLKIEIEKFLDEAAAAKNDGKFALAADKYSSAIERQKDINRLFPNSVHASDKKISEYSNLAADSKSRIYASEIIALDKKFSQAISFGDISKAAELSPALVSKVEQFRKEFPRNNDISSEDLIRVRYLNFAMKQIPAIQKLVNSELLPIDKGVKMLKSEVTQKLYNDVMQENPSRDQSDKYKPVESVTYQEALSFCQRLGWILGKKVTLPTEAQFIKAVGNLRYADIDAISWNAANSDGSVHKVSTKKANDKGFFDLLGNVGEFVMASENSGSVKVLGGGAQTSTDAISVLPSSNMDTNQRNRMTGFRIVVSQ